MGPPLITALPELLCTASSVSALKRTRPRLLGEQRPRADGVSRDARGFGGGNPMVPGVCSVAASRFLFLLSKAENQDAKHLC